MEKLKLVLANEEFKFQYLDLVKECEKEIKLTGFDCCIPISSLDSFENDIIDLRNRQNEINLPEGWVKESVLWMIDEDKNLIIGCISIRHSLNDKLKFRGGHIAYYIRISQRNKGYGSKMLCLGLDYCRKVLNMDRVLITCSSNNIYSINTILNNGGMLHSEDIDNDIEFQRYYINLDK